MEIRKDGFYTHGKPFKLYSGTIHYFRVPEAYWKDRLLKLKAAGFNAVETYSCWNLHEPKEGEVCFEGGLDVLKFCKIAQEIGLMVIFRPGPYICAEWDFGGLPSWLLKDRNIRLRCDDELFLRRVKAYYGKLLGILAPMQDTRGGNIIAMQVENEYGSYGNDKSYLNKIADIMKESGIEVPLFTSDGGWCNMLSGGTLPGIYKTINFGSRAASAFNDLKPFQSDMPETCMEFWCGWFDHYGERHHTRKPDAVVKEMKVLIDRGANFNLYMFHGGTNFGFMGGANYGKKYQPTVTSYDYAAPLNEYGGYTPLYHQMRELIHNARGIVPGELPPSPEVQNIGIVALTEQANLLDSFYKASDKHYSARPESMEYYGLDYGYIIYKTVIEGKYSSALLRVEGVHDIAYLRINGREVKRYYRTKNGRKKRNDGFIYLLPSFDSECTIEILVEAMGRVNYGPELYDRKGIERVLLGAQELFGWEVYTVDTAKLNEAEYKNSPFVGGPAIFKGSFKADKNKDCFVSVKGFKKGIIIVNGINIGRYWHIGPQRTLYLPAPFLKDNNEIIVVEQEGAKSASIDIIDKNIL
jgi:beta-galactosidase